MRRLGGRPAQDPHLRSAREIAGYDVHATDGMVGKVDGYLLDDADWSIRWIVVDTGHWWHSRPILIAPGAIGEVLWAGGRVRLAIDQGAVRAAPGYERDRLADADYQEKLRERA